MAIEIISDKICPHCGGNEWVVYFSKDKRGIIRTRYRCRVKNNESSVLWRKNNPDKIQEKYNRKVNSGYFKSERIKKYCRKQRDELSDLYIKMLLTNTLKKKFKDITSEEIINKRNEIIKLREYELLPTKIRRRNCINKSSRKGCLELTDHYVKHSLRLYRKYHGILDKTFSLEQISIHRALLIAERKSRTKNSNTYIKNCIATNLRYEGYKVSFDDIYLKDVVRYNSLSRIKRKFKEVSKIII